MEFSIDYFTRLADEAVSQIKYPDVCAGLYDPIRYSMAAGGKRLRPSLCMAVYAALAHGNPLDVISQATALEMYHNFTLLHDDVMDNADLRRGQPTVHRKWDANTAILSGDTMLSMAYGMLAKDAGERFRAVFDVFNRTALEIDEGQQLDMEFETRRRVTIEEYMEMIRLKTSVLLGCACQIGAIMAGASEEVCEKFYNYGISLGLAFQLQDDWLDTFGDPVIFGKEIGGDIVNKKKTWLLITSLAEAEEEVEGILGEDLVPEERVTQIKRVYDHLGLSKRCAAVAMRYADEAVAALRGVALDRDAEDFFVDLAHKAATRNH